MGVFPIFQGFSKKAWERSEFTETQQRMYTAEKLENFRWISKLVATYSKYELREKDAVEEELCQWLREVGQFAEVAYATPPLELLLKHFDSLNQPGFPFEGYYALSPCPYITAALPIHSSLPASNLRAQGYFATSSGVRLLKSIKGQVAKLPATVFSRWIHEHDCLGLTRQEEVDQEARNRCKCSRRRQQIIISICGTSSLQQAIHDLRAIRRSHPGAPGKDGAAVHTGFWDLYQGMKPALLDGIDKGLRMSPLKGDDQLDALEAQCCGSIADRDVQRELVVTGHSMGGAIAHLLCLDLLSPTLDSPGSTPAQFSQLDRPPGLTTLTSRDDIAGRLTGCSDESFLRQSGLESLEIITFGEPRTGNQALVDYWVTLKKRHQDEFGIPVREWCVKAYNDGVTSLPLMKFGYRHFSQEPLYTVNGKVYRVPSDERECALFRVAPSGSASTSSPSCQTASDVDCPAEPNTTLPQAVALYPTINATTNSSIPLSPLGGHNYYNERDLEGRYLRRMEWLERSGFNQDGWEERYREIIKSHPT
ncbi:hypothetical protein D9756_006448 [Leucocoprinus leucothites]|uniref:Fungal lipase-type domain-containing protein n=1 Tax=Leucocoprinus leucothites TaxID=201217 RepID=A0A8H5G1Y4_9AGAR|nr:hypothetical protein D9756_006448 [Leucoagaricus leucothites]